MSVSVEVQTALEPTEDESKVERALLKLFPSAHIERIAKPNDTVALRARGNGLEFLSNLRNLIRQQRIRSAARLVLTRSLSESQFQFYLNKQAAFMGRVSFCEAERESPHGPISIQVECEDPQSVIDYLALPPTLAES
ncbi:MAG: RNA-binding domain-containing protein [Candidatus Bathyarchaeia archaeon]